MISSKIGAVLFSIIALLTLLVTFGLPLGEYTLGGQHTILPTKMRIITGISFLIQTFAVFVILQAGGVIHRYFPLGLIKGICFFFSIYMSLNVFMNFMSESPKEKYVMTPLAMVAAICFWITAFNIKK